jgi:hypothetical protein
MVTGIKEDAHRLIDQLPEGATWADLLDLIIVRHKIEAGLADGQAGRVISSEELRRRLGLD